MAANGVNLDALIPRADLRVGDGVVAGERGPVELTYTHFMENDFFVKFLRKPEFQRETVHWSPQKIVDLVTAFLDRRLVPAVILWRAGQTNFVVDGAHRISALLAWMYDDYGDGDRSKKLFGPYIPPEQDAVAKRTRKLVNDNIGQFKLYQAGLTHPTVVTDEQQARMSNLTVSFFVAQWVPATSAKAAEDSFFTINDAATPLDRTEKRIIKSRDSALAIASRAISHGGSGYEYWRNFQEPVKKSVVESASDIYDVLYRPPLTEGPIDTLDVPVAGRGYSVLPFVFDLVNQVNSANAADSTEGKPKDKMKDDLDGAETLRFLKQTWRTVSRIAGKEPTSLGLHPVVYFYTGGGAFSPWAFLAWSQIADRLFATNRVNRFLDVRSEFERYIIAHKWAMTEIIHKNGSGDRSTPWLERYWSLVLDTFMDKKAYDEVVQIIHSDPKFMFLLVKDPILRLPAEDRKPGTGKFSHRTRTAAVWGAALPGAPRCAYCNGLWHRGSFHGDHIIPKRDGGDNSPSNYAIAHPYCDATYKDLRAKRA